MKFSSMRKAAGKQADVMKAYAEGKEIQAGDDAKNYPIPHVNGKQPVRTFKVIEVTSYT
jgi:hypothetical protein